MILKDMLITNNGGTMQPILVLFTFSFGSMAEPQVGYRTQTTIFTPLQNQYRTPEIGELC